MQISCKTVGCVRKGYWIEVGPSGEKLFCYHVRHDGKNHTVKVALTDLIEMMYEENVVPPQKSLTRPTNNDYISRQ